MKKRVYDALYILTFIVSIGFAIYALFVGESEVCRPVNSIVALFAAVGLGLLGQNFFIYSSFFTRETARHIEGYDDDD